MTENVTLSQEVCQSLGVQILRRHNTSRVNAECVAKALVAAERDGQHGHGLSRLPSYAAQAASGKVNGQAVPSVNRAATAAIRVDAKYGFAFPALARAIEHLVELTPQAGIATAAVTRSHHFGQAGYHVEQLADYGLIGLIFGNSPKAIAPWGGKSGVFGTNPIAFAAPRRDEPPLVIDLSLSKVARGKVMIAANQGNPIPEGWALDKHGNPTTNAAAALAGTMLPMGDAKGSALVMMVEILAAALVGANLGFEASSFFDAEGPPPGVGQLIIAVQPGVLSAGVFSERLETLIDAVIAQPGARLPGSRRLSARARNQSITIPQALYEELQELV